MLLALSVLAIPAMAESQVSQISQISGSPVGCKTGTGSYQRIELQGKVLLNTAFLPTDPKERSELVRNAIELQLKHLVGYFRTTSSGGMNAAIASYRGAPRISEPQTVTYGSSFPVDNFLAARGGANSAYTQKALQRGEVKADDSALLIPYQSELLIADCTPNGFQKAAPVKLPLDPFLSFWLEKKEARKSRTFNRGKLDAMPNCLSSELVEFGTSDINWFFWSPVMPKTDSAGKTVKCQIDGPMKIYQPEILASKAVEPAPALAPEFFGKLKEFKSTAIFGIISRNEYFAKLDTLKLKDLIQSTESVCKKAQNVPSCLTAWEKALTPVEGKPFYEPGTYHFLTFLKYLHTLVSLDQLSLEKTSTPDQEIVLKYRGHFIDSTMPASGTVYFGTTTLDYGPRASKAYVSTLHTALKDSNAIFYVGHAGLGHNFLIEEFTKLWKQDHLPAFKREHPLWVGIYNCEGFSYFGFDQESLFKPGKFDLYMTASSGTEAGAKYPLAQLSILNDLYAGRKVDVAKTMALYVQSREFSTITRLTSASTSAGAK
ncbi:MAG: hypothetical protein ACJ763_10705 [Bdellovibrionia bacterium]